MPGAPESVPCLRNGASSFLLSLLPKKGVPRTLESLPGPNPAPQNRSHGQGPARPAGSGRLAARDLSVRDSNPPAVGRGLEGRPVAIGRRWGLRRARGGEGDGGVARQARRAAIGLGRVGAWPRAADRRWGRRRRESRLLAVHLSRRPGPRSCTRRCPRRHEPLQGIQKFRHTEARPPRREVSPAVLARRHPSPPWLRAGSPPSPPAPGAPLKARVRRPGRPFGARRSEPGAPETLWAR